MKMTRLIRDLSQKSGKQVTLDMKGKETEIDRNVVDALYEPMVHMIRNSVDHGIESVKKRLGESLTNVSCFAGGAILADGKVGLILDMHGIFNSSF